jgi:hypothetical protein
VKAARAARLRRRTLAGTRRRDLAGTTARPGANSGLATRWHEIPPVLTVLRLYFIIKVEK